MIGHGLGLRHASVCFGLYLTKEFVCGSVSPPGGFARLERDGIYLQRHFHNTSYWIPFSFIQVGPARMYRVT